VIVTKYGISVNELRLPWNNILYENIEGRFY